MRTNTTTGRAAALAMILGACTAAATGQIRPSGVDRNIHQRDLPLVIAQPGEWFVAEDLSTAGKNPAGPGLLRIDSPDVVLNLRNHTIVGGLWIDAAERLTVRDGRIAGHYALGGKASHGVTLERVRIAGGEKPGPLALSLGNGAVLRHLTVEPPGFSLGLRIGHDGLIEHCEIAGGGIEAGDRCTLLSVTADVAAGSAVVTGQGSRLEDCGLQSDSSEPTLVVGAGSQLLRTRAANSVGDGISAGAAVQMTRCTGSGNTGIDAEEKAQIAGCRATGVVAGIRVQQGATVEDSFADAAGGIGIWVTDDARVLRNFIGNGQTQGWGGIVARGDGNEIDYNQIGGVEVGVYVLGTAGTITRNFVRGAGTPLKTANGNKVGEIIDLRKGGELPADACDANVVY